MSKELLKQELEKAELQVDLLKALIQHGCYICVRERGGDRLSSYKAPEGYTHAMSFDTAALHGTFVVYGHNLESIREMAHYYAQKKYSQSTYREKVENLSQLGRWIEYKMIVGPYYCLDDKEKALVQAGGTAYYEENPVLISPQIQQIVGIYPDWYFADKPCANETIYVSSVGRLFSLSELQEYPDVEAEKLFTSFLSSDVV